MSDETSILLEEIEALTSAPKAAAESDLPRLERTLTDGYARALSLEAERLRVERRIGELAGEEGDAAAKSAELASLAKRAAAAESDRVHLRGALALLRVRTDAARAAGAAA